MKTNTGNLMPALLPPTETFPLAVAILCIIRQLKCINTDEVWTLGRPSATDKTFPLLSLCNFPCCFLPGGSPQPFCYTSVVLSLPYLSLPPPPLSHLSPLFSVSALP